MINRCIGCYYHDSKENVCTHGSPIFLDDTCTDYQDNEFVWQIRAEVIDECIKFIKEHSGEHYIDCDGYFGGQLESVFNVDYWIDDLEQLKEI